MTCGDRARCPTRLRRQRGIRPVNVGQSRGSGRRQAGRLPQRCDKEQDNKEVAGTAGNYEEVPEGVGVANVVVEDQKDGSQGVAQAADEHPPQPGIGNQAD